MGTVSLAAKSLCLWVRAIEKYGKVYKYLPEFIIITHNMLADKAHYCTRMYLHKKKYQLKIYFMLAAQQSTTFSL